MKALRIKKTKTWIDPYEGIDSDHPFLTYETEWRIEPKQYIFTKSGIYYQKDRYELVDIEYTVKNPVKPKPKKITITIDEDSAHKHNGDRYFCTISVDYDKHTASKNLCVYDHHLIDVPPSISQIIKEINEELNDIFNIE